MDIPHAFQRCLPLAFLQTTAEIDAEIREELEFHLHMRTQDNLHAGMSPEKARLDAQQRFGDFEANRRACRKILLGPRLVLHRLPIGLLLVLLGTVIYQGVLLSKLQTSNRDQIDSLTQLVEQLRAGRETVKDEATVIPYLQWNLDLHYDTTAVDDHAGREERADREELAGWNTTNDPLQKQWSDWGALAKQAEYD